MSLAEEWRKGRRDGAREHEGETGDMTNQGNRMEHKEGEKTQGLTQTNTDT